MEKDLKHLFYGGGILMQYISKRKLIGLITNEWFGIETCKIEDIISFIENIPDEIGVEIENEDIPPPPKAPLLRVLYEGFKDK